MRELRVAAVLHQDVMAGRGGDLKNRVAAGLKDLGVDGFEQRQADEVAPDTYRLARLDLGRVVNKDVGELREARVVHGVFLSSSQGLSV